MFILLNETKTLCVVCAICGQWWCPHPNSVRDLLRTSKSLALACSAEGSREMLRASSLKGVTIIMEKVVRCQCDMEWLEDVWPCLYLSTHLGQPWAPGNIRVWYVVKVAGLSKCFNQNNYCLLRGAVCVLSPSLHSRFPRIYDLLIGKSYLKLTGS